MGVSKYLCCAFSQYWYVVHLGYVNHEAEKGGGFTDGVRMPVLRWLPFEGG